MFVLFLVLFLISSIFNIVLFLYLRKSAVMLFNFEDAMKRMVSNLDRSKKNLENILNRPVYSDTPEIKAVVNEVNRAINFLTSISVKSSGDSNNLS
jgi:hypothetical protein